MNENIFRAYDIRGNAEQDLTPDVLVKIGFVLGNKVKDSGSDAIYVGHDSRLSCQRIFTDLCVGINSAGIKVLNLGLVPTPMVYYATNVGSTSHGVMITGSHNPKDDNGLKIVLDGGPVSGLDILNYVKKVESCATNEANIENISFEDQYIHEVVSKSSTSKKLKIVLDSGNGAAGILAHKTFVALGHETISINQEPDGNFPNHHPDPSKEKNLEQIKSKISETNADLGLAFDGDGDRVGLITNNGDFVLSDHIIMMLAEYYLKQTKGPVVFDVKCSDELGKMIEQNGGKIINISTSTQTMVRQGYSPYGSSKAFLEAASRSWAQELSDAGVTVNVLLPGGATDTDLLPPSKDKKGADGNLLSPSVMINPALWLASNGSDGVTGARFIARHWDDGAPLKAQDGAIKQPKIM